MFELAPDTALPVLVLGLVISDAALVKVFLSLPVGDMQRQLHRQLKDRGRCLEVRKVVKVPGGRRRANQAGNSAP